MALRIAAEMLKDAMQALRGRFARQGPPERRECVEMLAAVNMLTVMLDQLAELLGEGAHGQDDLDGAAAAFRLVGKMLGAGCTGRYRGAASGPEKRLAEGLAAARDRAQELLGRVEESLLRFRPADE
ncbi:MAG: hypothetical protein U0797_12895 [Gemmataceae bacterium]